MSIASLPNNKWACASSALGIELEFLIVIDDEHKFGIDPTRHTYHLIVFYSMLISSALGFSCIQGVMPFFEINFCAQN
jgi:hypothetical protein